MTRIVTFEARNFRSLSDVRLEQLPAAVLFYGANEAGKSNILQGLGCWLRLLRSVGMTDLYEGAKSIDPEVHGEVFRQATYDQPALELGGRLLIDEQAFEFHLRVTAEEVTIFDAIWPGGRATEPVSQHAPEARKLQEFLSGGWVFVSAERQFSDEYITGHALESGSAEDPQREKVERGNKLDPKGSDLKRHLFLAANSLDRRLRSRFQDQFCVRIKAGPFAEIPTPAMALNGSEIELLVGPARVEDRGSGYRQWAILCGMLTMSGASIAGVEEPEAHLSWESQRAIAQAFRDFSAKGPPHQLFVTTHSAICLDMTPDDTWFEVAMSGQGTVVRRRQSRGELKALFPDLPDARLDDKVLRLMQGGYVRLPERALKHLGAQPDEHLYCALEESPARAVRLLSQDDMGDYLAP